MIAVQAKESQKSSDLTQVLLGERPQEKSRFSDILALVERVKAGAKEGKVEGLKLLIAEDAQEMKIPLQALASVKNMPRNANALRTDTASTSSPLGPTVQRASIEPKSQKEQMLALLLSSSSELIEEEESVESLGALLEPKVVTQLSEETLKSTLIRAKQQLRAQIETVIKEQQIEIKTMPKSLKGLYDLAQKFQINVEKITLETLQVKTESAVSAAVRTLPILVRQERMAAPQVSALRNALERTAQQDEAAQEGDDQPLKKLLSGVGPGAKSHPFASVVTSEVPSQPQALADEAVPTVKSDLKAAAAALSQPQGVKVEAEMGTLHAASATTQASSAVESTAKSDAPQGTTEQLADEAVPTVKSDLKAAAAALSQPQGVKVEAEIGTLHAASATTQASSAVESTAKSDAPQGTTEQKDAIAVTTLKADALEVKVKEAQQTLRHFATELREAVENYKPPFTRLKITLNPAKLGEVDVTMIQRGNNVHINVSSNSAALNLLAQNAAELKTQLANNGVVNTTMQFSTAHGEHSQQGQQQRSQTFAQSYRPLEALSEEELELITSIEITLPRYA